MIIIEINKYIRLSMKYLAIDHFNLSCDGKNKNMALTYFFQNIVNNLRDVLKELVIFFLIT